MTEQKITLEQADCLEYMKTLPDNSIDLLFTDPPYALGSEIIIKENGKPDYKKAVDFMNKWDMPTGEFWEEWFSEAKRVLKHGGHCLVFGMDRQNFMFKYYAHLAGFTGKQSLYWYFICNDDQTELLTKRGWIKYSEINKDDIVLTMNIETEQSQWQEIQDIHLYDVKDLDMIRIVNRDLDQFVTPNHRILHQTRTNPRYDFGNWQYAQAHTFLRQKSPLIKLPLAFRNVEGREEYGEKLCHLIGWVLTDGYYQKGDNSIRISQSSTNITKVERIRDLLLSLQMDFKEYSRQRDYTYQGVTKQYTEYVFYFNNETSAWIKELFPDKRPTWDLLNMTYEERYSLFLGMMAGDGSYKMINKYTDIYEALDSQENFNGTFTKNRQTAEFMQALASSLGFSTSLRECRSKTTVNISWKQTTGIQQAKNKIFTEQYTGKVWSVTTKNSNYCIRRNGKVSFTGNSNFPKASDLSKMIDKRLGLRSNENRGFSVVGDDGRTGGLNQVELSYRKDYGYQSPPVVSDLAKKYDGLKYSIAPLKQTCEEIMVFQKPFKHKSCLHDVLAYESGDETITVSALDIDGCRVGLNGEKAPSGSAKRVYKANQYTEEKIYGHNKVTPDSGRYPAQTFIDTGAGEVIDRQSGIQKGSRQIKSKAGSDDSGIGLQSFKIKYDKIGGYDDKGGASRILHTCDYEEGEYDIFYYSAKVSKRERNEGLEGFEEKEGGAKNSSGRSIAGKDPYAKTMYKNNHPTVKPIKLLTNILKLFKTPNKQVILDPFMGSGSMGIAAHNLGYEYIGVELSEEYYKIAEARINHVQTKGKKELEPII